ncbi:MAG: metallophosphoesterase [Parvibaculaceae bacterium]
MSQEGILILSLREISWLHISDIHMGAEGQKRLWPRFEVVLLEDLEKLLRKTPRIEVVILSGDLVQKGDCEEYEMLDGLLDRILGKIRQSGSSPRLITVPGNHDLVRPGGHSVGAVALAQYWKNSDVREQFWEPSGDEYRSIVSEAFENYTRWRERSISRGIHMEPIRRGKLPGDASYLVETSSGRTGIIALNSAWLQFGAGDYENELHVDVNQLLEVTNGKPDDWVNENDVNLLVTHHPSTWLHRESFTNWSNEIDPSGRFDSHVFGHMHEPLTSTIAYGGGATKRSVQAASLFGMETFGTERKKRIHGYSVSKIHITEVERQLTSWPRRLIELSGGGWKLAPDNTQNIDEDSGSFAIDYKIDRQSALKSVTELKVVATTDFRNSGVEFDLSRVEYQLGHFREHLNVRRVELQSCVNAIREKKAAWIVADWGMGGDGFIAAVCKHSQLPIGKIYRLDFSKYIDRQSYFDNVHAQFGVTFQQICDAIALADGPSIFIFDDVDASLLQGDTQNNRQSDIELLAETVSAFAIETRIILRTRRSLKSQRFSVIQLEPLDEADLAVYVRESELGDGRYAKPDAISTIYRHTDGIPARIDATLRDLEIVSIGDLIVSDTDFSDVSVGVVSTPLALIAAISELSKSDDNSDQRAFSLLVALSALPHGDRLARIKRFLGPHAFYPSHARTLLERSLIDAVKLSGIAEASGDDTSKALVVPRIVRECVRDFIDEETAKSMDRHAIELFFGENWSSGVVDKSPTGKKIRDPLCDGREIQNAGALVLRLVRRSLEDKSISDSEAAIRLAISFIKCLNLGDHFRSVVSFCNDVIHLIDELGGFEEQANAIRYEQARNLRMIGLTEDALKLFDSLDHSAFSTIQRQGAELGLALCHEKLQNLNEAASAAKRVIALDKHSNLALQAKLIIAEQIADRKERKSALERLLATARKQEANVLVNNILLTLSQEVDAKSDEAINGLRDIVKNARSKSDFYNGARAIVKLAKSLEASSGLSSEERESLIGAYHFLYNERIYGLFDTCHAALWNEFVRLGDNDNLLNLFRRSSFIWRLNGHEKKEEEYLRKLTIIVRDLLVQDIRRVTRDGAYFVVRASGVRGAHDVV